MANVKRSTLGCLLEMVLHIEPYAKGFEVFGHDKIGRKVVLARRTALEPILLEGAQAAQCLADFSGKPVTLQVQSESTEEFLPKKHSEEGLPDVDQGLLPLDDVDL